MILTAWVSPSRPRAFLCPLISPSFALRLRRTGSGFTPLRVCLPYRPGQPPAKKESPAHKRSEGEGTADLQQGSPRPTPALFLLPPASQQIFPSALMPPCLSSPSDSRVWPCVPYHS